MDGSNIEQIDRYGSGSDEALWFHLLVYHIVQQVPNGQWCTYGHIAYLCGRPENSRQVGFALKHLPSNENLRYNTTNTPWWRIVGSGGKISAIGIRQHQLERLRQEMDVTDKGEVSSEAYWTPEPEDIDLDPQ